MRNLKHVNSLAPTNCFRILHAEEREIDQGMCKSVSLAKASPPSEYHPTRHRTILMMQPLAKKTMHQYAKRLVA